MIKRQPIENSKESVLTKAILRASERLKIERTELMLILGISAATLTRLYHHERLINPASKEGELAILLLRIYQILVNLFGGDFSQCQRWLRHMNTHLGTTPIELLKNIPGVIKVLNYLEFFQDKI